MNKETAKSIKAIVLDVDGTLTDGLLIHNGNNVESRAFDVKDGFGVTLALAAGLKVGILSGKKSPVIEERAKVLKMNFICQGHFDKLEGFNLVLRNERLTAPEVAYMGDDILDLPALTRAGLSACPSDAHPEVRNRADFVSKFPGGRGAVRDFIEVLLKARGQWNALFLKFAQLKNK
jgi:3-deoxy-D-manno-octulosonate 8-phosphate phosphatase (KDO 8-P phosphatase)